MATKMRISHKETQAVNQSGQVDKYKGKRLGPAAYKNHLRAIANKKEKSDKKAISEEKTVKTVMRVPTVMENRLALAERRATPHQRREKKPDDGLDHSLPYLSGNIQITVITNGTTESVKEKLGYRGTEAQFVVEQLGINAKSKGIKVMSK